MAAEEKCWTHDERTALAEAVQQMPPHEHPPLYRIVLASDPDGLENCNDDPDGAIILFHLLEPQTLRELEGYIASRNANTQSEIEENNPAEQESDKEENNPAEQESDKEENNPAEQESEKASSKATSSTEKSSSNKGSKASDEKAKGGSIKARLRKSSKKSDAGHSKKK